MMKKRMIKKSKKISSTSHGYITLVLIGVALFAFLIATGFMHTVTPPYDGTTYFLVSPTVKASKNSTLQLQSLRFTTSTPTPASSPTPTPTIVPCGTTCGVNFACGSPITVGGKIIDSSGKGVSGALVNVYDNNRQNNPGLYARSSDSVRTDTQGNFRETGLVCGGLNVDTGDAYAVGPDWNACTNGFKCTNPHPDIINSQQANKPGMPDCAKNTSCNFSVVLSP